MRISLVDTWNGSEQWMARQCKSIDQINAWHCSNAFLERMGQPYPLAPCPGPNGPECEREDIVTTSIRAALIATAAAFLPILAEAQQELIFASTGSKNPKDEPWKYVQALAGSDIQTNPPETNEAVAGSGIQFTRTVDQMPSEAIQQEIDDKLDVKAMHQLLMEEGVDKFVKPQQALLSLIAEKRKELLPTS